MHLTVLSASDVATASSSLTPNFLMSLMALVFVRLSSDSQIEMPHRTTVGTDSYNALFMPAHMDDFGTSMKVVSLPKGPSQEGLPASTLLLDERTGALKALINARSLTALRNAAGECRFCHTIMGHWLQTGPQMKTDALSSFTRLASQSLVYSLCDTNYQL